jgi:hypothetical protein
MESQLSEVMRIEIKMKMQMIQSVSSVNLIQMRLMKMLYNGKQMMNAESRLCVDSQWIQVMNGKSLLKVINNPK